MKTKQTKQNEKKKTNHVTQRWNTNDTFHCFFFLFSCSLLLISTRNNTQFSVDIKNAVGIHFMCTKIQAIRLRIAKFLWSKVFYENLISYFWKSHIKIIMVAEVSTNPQADNKFFFAFIMEKWLFYLKLLGVIVMKATTKQYQYFFFILNESCFCLSPITMPIKLFKM